MVGPIRPQFVLFGSSIVEFSYGEDGWGAILSNLYARKKLEAVSNFLSNSAGHFQADIFLRGYGGWNSKQALQVLDKIFPKDSAIQPSLVIVYFGGNDSMLPHPSGLTPHVPLPDYINNMKKIGIHLKSLSEKTRVIFLTTPPVNQDLIREIMGSQVADYRTNESCRVYAEACLALCDEIDVKSIDLWTAFHQQDDWHTTCFTDGIHLSGVGSEIVAREIVKVLGEAEWLPRLHWNSLPSEFEVLKPCLL